MDFKLRLKSKKLGSGRFQVNFSTEGFVMDYYGYLLTEPTTSVREVVEKIQRHLGAAQSTDKYFQRNLFSLGKREVNSGRVMIFRRGAPSEGQS
ncbi:MAG TPA: hypothetical protein VK508_03830 [Cyclobacteriaceae bacterium]|nr:hypothetical protein [Cyclobacteriaceae bacterium]